MYCFLHSRDICTNKIGAKISDVRILLVGGQSAVYLPTRIISWRLQLEHKPVHAMTQAFRRHCLTAEARILLISGGGLISIG